MVGWRLGCGGGVWRSSLESGGEGSLLFGGGVVERRDVLAEDGLCWSWRWLKTCMTDGTIGRDCALAVRCRGEGDISRGGDEPGGTWTGARGRDWADSLWRGCFLDLCGECDDMGFWVGGTKERRDRLADNKDVRAFPTWSRCLQLQGSAATNGSCLEASASPSADTQKHGHDSPSEQKVRNIAPSGRAIVRPLPGSSMSTSVSRPTRSSCSSRGTSRPSSTSSQRTGATRQPRPPQTCTDGTHACPP